MPVGYNQSKGAIDKRNPVFLLRPTPSGWTYHQVCKSYGGQSERFLRPWGVVQEQNGSHLGRRGMLPALPLHRAKAHPGARYYC